MANNYLTKERRYWGKVLLDGIFLVIAFLTIHWVKRGDFHIDDHFRKFLPILFVTWFLVTVLSRKFKVLARDDYFSRLRPYWAAAIVFVLLLTLLLYILGWVAISRFIVYGTAALYFMMESAYLATHLLLAKRKDAGHPLPFAVLFFLLELLAVLAAFLLMYFSKRETFRLEEKYQIALMALFFTWLLVSLLVHRFKVRTNGTLWQAFIPFWQSEALILGLVSFMVFVAARGSMSRLIIFGSVGGFALLENLVVAVHYLFAQFRRADEDPAELLADELAHPQVPMAVAVEEREDREEIVAERYRFQERDDSQEAFRRRIERLFLNKFQEVYDFIGQYVDLRHFDALSSVYLFAASVVNIEIFEDDSLSFFFNFEKVNNFRHANRVLIALNEKIKSGGVLIGCFESLDQRKTRIFARFPSWLARFCYAGDFFYKRIMPKLPALKRIYFFFSRGKNRVMSRTEVLGRLYYCGFEIIGLRAINNIYYFIAKKAGKPRSDSRPSYGPIFRQRRLGMNGKIIHIYKLRTMHPFAEYLHQYIFEKHQLEESGKIRDDFRITSWGRFFRKALIDELPMLVNWLKRDLKIVGVRPLSETFFRTYPEDLQKERVRFKPGLIPPYYADMPDGIEEVWASERRYLARYARYPVRTDAIYFFRALNNILFHHAKSS